jgi:hypothetical protein
MIDIELRDNWRNAIVKILPRKLLEDLAKFKCGVERPRTIHGDYLKGMVLTNWTLCEKDIFKHLNLAKEKK